MKLLVNSSNPFFGKFLCHRLSIEGIEMQCVSSDREMIHLAHGQSYDAIILVATRFSIWKLHPIRILVARNKVLVLSSVYDEHSVVEALQSGIFMYMSLPVDISRLIQKIRLLA